MAALARASPGCVLEVRLPKRPVALVQGFRLAMPELLRRRFPGQVGLPWTGCVVFVPGSLQQVFQQTQVEVPDNLPNPAVELCCILFLLVL